MPSIMPETIIFRRVVVQDGHKHLGLETWTLVTLRPKRNSAPTATTSPYPYNRMDSYRK